MAATAAANDYVAIVTTGKGDDDGVVTAPRGDDTRHHRPAPGPLFPPLLSAASFFIICPHGAAVAAPRLVCGGRAPWYATRMASQVQVQAQAQAQAQVLALVSLPARLCPRPCLTRSLRSCLAVEHTESAKQDDIMAAR